MPELPEVETIRRTLKNFIIGKKIERIVVHYDKIITGNSKAFIDSIVGQEIHDIDRIGKYLIFILDNQAFLSHLRMEGKYQITKAQAPQKKHEHLIFYLNDGTALRYMDTRKFGRFELVNIATYRHDFPLKKLGPEPWDADPAMLHARLQRSSLPIKTLLLDQSILAGIGNIYANEICFLMKLHPKTPGKRLGKKRVVQLLQAAKSILEDAVSQGGTTIHTYNANGISGLFQIYLKVHMQEKCPVCGTSISKEMVHGRGTYFCPRCQKTI